MIFGSKEQKTRLAVFLKHMNVCLLKKSRSSGQSRFHSEAYFCRQRLLSFSFAVLNILTVFIFVCCHIYGHKMGMTAPRLVFSLLCLSKKRGRDKRISSVKVLSFLYKKKNFPMSLPLDFFSYFRTESIPTLRRHW